MGPGVQAAGFQECSRPCRKAAGRGRTVEGAGHDGIPPGHRGTAMKLPVYIGLLDEAEATLAASFRVVAEGHGDEPDVHFILQTLARMCDAHREALKPVIDRYGEDVEGEEAHRLTA